MKKVMGAVGTFLILVVLTVVGRMVGNGAVQITTSPDVEETLVQVSSQLNQRLPKMVDKDTRIDTTTAGPGKAFTYFYTYPSYASTDFNPNVLHAALEPAVRKNECGDGQMRKMFQAGVTAYFVYRGNDGVEITRTSVSPADCGI